MAVKTQQPKSRSKAPATAKKGTRAAKTSAAKTGGPVARRDGKAGTRGRAKRVGFVEDNELSARELRELERRVGDLNNRTRYLVVTVLGPGFVLYYNVSEDTYGWNEPSHATLFKRQEAAVAVQQLLGDSDTVTTGTVNARGQLVRKSVQLPKLSGSARVSSVGTPAKKPRKARAKR
jgi:hypothetical protein